MILSVRRFVRSSVGGPQPQRPTRYNEASMTPEIEIYDTTLRDGTQGEGVTFSVADKLRIAERLDAFGVHYIEGGWPGSNPKDIEFFDAGEAPDVPPRAARGVRLDAPQGRAASSDDDQVRLLLDADTPVVTIFGKTWLLHVREVLQTTPEENLAMIARHRRATSRRTASSSSTTPSTRSTATRTTASTRWRPGRPPSAAGADVVVLCDTNGGSLPAEIAEITRHARAQSDDAHRHPHARRHRPGRRQRAGGARRRRHARPGHDQRLRRADRQLQPDERDADPAVQAEDGRRCRPSRWRS